MYMYKIELLFLWIICITIWRHVESVSTLNDSLHEYVENQEKEWNDYEEMERIKKNESQYQNKEDSRIVLNNDESGIVLNKDKQMDGAKQEKNETGNNDNDSNNNSRSSVMISASKMYNDAAKWMKQTVFNHLQRNENIQDNESEINWNFTNGKNNRKSYNMTEVQENNGNNNTNNSGLIYDENMTNNTIEEKRDETVSIPTTDPSNETIKDITTWTPSSNEKEKPMSTIRRNEKNNQNTTSSKSKFWSFSSFTILALIIGNIISLIAIICGIYYFIKCCKRRRRFNEDEETDDEDTQPRYRTAHTFRDTPLVKPTYTQNYKTERSNDMHDTLHVNSKSNYPTRTNSNIVDYSKTHPNSLQQSQQQAHPRGYYDRARGSLPNSSVVYQQCRQPSRPIPSCNERIEVKNGNKYSIMNVNQIENDDSLMKQRSSVEF